MEQEFNQPDQSNNLESLFLNLNLGTNQTNQSVANNLNDIGGLFSNLTINQNAQQGQNVFGNQVGVNLNIEINPQISLQGGNQSQTTSQQKFNIQKRNPSPTYQDRQNIFNHRKTNVRTRWKKGDTPDFRGGKNGDTEDAHDDLNFSGYNAESCRNSKNTDRNRSRSRSGNKRGSRDKTR